MDDTRHGRAVHLPAHGKALSSPTERALPFRYDCTQGGVLALRNKGKAFALLALIALVLAMVPNRAYAGTLEYGGVVVGAAPCSDKWHAAAEMCGYDWDSFSNATKSRLVGTRYSDFYALRSSLVRLDEYMASMPLGSFAMSLVETVSGEDASQYWIANMGVGELTPTIDGAKIDIQFAMRAGNVEHGGGDDNGGGDSGGTSPVVDNSPMTLTMMPSTYTGVRTYDNTKWYCAGTSLAEDKYYLGETVDVTFDGPAAYTLRAYQQYKRVVRFSYSSGYKVAVYVCAGNGADVHLNPEVAQVGPDTFTRTRGITQDLPVGSMYGTDEVPITVNSITRDSIALQYVGNNTGGMNLTISARSSATNGTISSSSWFLACEIPAGEMGPTGGGSGSGSGGGGGGGSTSIYNNNDSHDVTTTTTIHNTTNNVSTTTNNVDNTTYVTNNNYETTMDVDLQPITKRLDSIDTKLGAIGRDLDDVYDLLDEQWAGLSGWLSKIYARQAQIYSAMDDVIPWLEAILGEMVNLQHPDSGTSTLLGYVKQIVDKLDNLQVGGGGDGSPVDLSSIEELLKAYTTTPDYGGGGAEGQFSVADINSFILEEMRRFNAQMVGYTDEIEDLLRPDGGVTPPELDPTGEFDDDEGMDAKIADRMGELVKHFPYSLPWDVGIVLNLLRSAPVAPEFDVGVIGSSEDMHIDLSPYEPVAVVTRSGSVVLFAVGLILRTRTLLGSGGDA